MARSQHAGPRGNGLDSVPAGREERLVRRDFVHALVVLLLGLIVFAGWLPAQQYGDGRRFVSHFSSIEFSPQPVSHWAYLPSALVFKRSLHAVGIDASPGVVLQLFSALFTALGLSASWLLARLFGATRQGAWWSVGFVGLSAALGLFGRVVEVHAFHFGVVALTLTALMGLTRGSLGRALGIILILGPSLFMSHHSGLMLYPGLAVLGALAVEGRLRVRTGLLCGAAAGLALFASLWISAHGFGQSIPELFATSGHQVASDINPERITGLWANYVMPLSFAWLLIGLGWIRLARQSRALWFVTLALCLPEMLFFAWWAVQENGAYLLGFLPVLIAIGAQATPSIDMPIAWLTDRKRTALLAAQCLITAWFVGGLLNGVGAQQGPERFAVLERAMAPVVGPKIVFTMDPTVQSPSARIDNLMEVKLFHSLTLGIAAGLSPEQLGEIFVEPADLEVYFVTHATQNLYLDRTSWVALDEHPEYTPYAEQVDRLFRENFRVEELEGGLVWKLEPKR